MEGEVKVQVQNQNLLEWIVRKLKLASSGDSTILVLSYIDDPNRILLSQPIERIQYSCLWSEGGIGFDVIFWEDSTTWSFLTTSPKQADDWVNTINRCVGSSLHSSGSGENESLKVEKNAVELFESEEKSKRGKSHPILNLSPPPQDEEEEEEKVHHVDQYNQNHERVLVRGMFESESEEDERVLKVRVEYEEQMVRLREDIHTLRHLYERRSREDKGKIAKLEEEVSRVRREEGERVRGLMVEVEEERKSCLHLRYQITSLQKTSGSKEEIREGEIRRLRREGKEVEIEMGVLEGEVERLKEMVREKHTKEQSLFSENEELKRRVRESNLSHQLRQEEFGMLEREVERLIKEREEMRMELQRMDRIVYGGKGKNR